MRRALILAPLALALCLTACGDDDDDDPADTATESTKPDTTTEGGGITVPDVSIPEITIPDVTIPDVSIPDFTIPDISIPDISIPDISLPDNADELFAQVFPNLDDDQIDCLVENLSGEFDVSAVTELLGECDIDPQDLLPGG